MSEFYRLGPALEDRYLEVEWDVPNGVVVDLPVGRDRIRLRDVPPLRIVDPLRSIADQERERLVDASDANNMLIPRVSNGSLHLADIPRHRQLEVFVASHRVINAITPYLTPMDEVYPLESAVGAYSLVNILTTADCLDGPSSKASWYVKYSRAMVVTQAAIRGSAVGHVNVFRVPEMRLYVYARECVVEAIERSGAEGYGAYPCVEVE